MAKNLGTFHLARVIKLGVLYGNYPMLLSAILNPSPIIRYNNGWTIVDAQEFRLREGSFIYGRLSKYLPDGEIVIVDPAQSSEFSQREPNMRIASSPFVYIPEHSGIAFLNVWGQISIETFAKRFAEVIVHSLGNFFVNCSIEPIVDLRSFSLKLRSLNSIYEISATVEIPNPLFGSLWKSLREYLEKRSAEKIKIKEEAGEGAALATSIAATVEKVSNGEIDQINPADVDIGDAAILMAADGYGSGYIKGAQGNKVVTIRTSETVKNFTFTRDPDPLDLYHAGLSVLEETARERGLQHPSRLENPDDPQK